MDQNVAKRWAEALRSGQYVQDRRQLRTGTGFCCLGVLCDMYRIEQGKGYWEDDRDEFVIADTDGEPLAIDDVQLPTEIKQWAGMFSHCGATRGGMVVTEIDWPDGTIGRACSLSEANDNGMDFTQIADFIETNWEIL